MADIELIIKRRLLLNDIARGREDEERLRKDAQGFVERANAVRSVTNQAVKELAALDASLGKGGA